MMAEVLAQYIESIHKKQKPILFLQESLDRCIYLIFSQFIGFSYFITGLRGLNSFSYKTLHDQTLFTFRELITTIDSAGMTCNMWSLAKKCWFKSAKHNLSKRPTTKLRKY